MMSLQTKNANHPKGAVINYDREGDESISENFQKNFKPQLILQIKIQTSLMFEEIISDTNAASQKKTLHFSCQQISFDFLFSDKIYLNIGNYSRPTDR